MSDKLIERKIEELLKEALVREKIQFDWELLEKARFFLMSIWKYNSQLNLTAAKSLEELIEKHFMDSVLILKFVSDWKEKNICDLGTGAGFPGIPLKLFLPDNECYLLDSSRKKINFLKYTITKLELKKISFYNERAETACRDEGLREKFDYLTARAVAEMPVLVEIGLPLIKNDGSMFAYKGPKGPEEKEKAENALKICGGEVVDQWNYGLSSGEQRVIYHVKKIKPSLIKYPRKTGQPEKKPL